MCTNRIKCIDDGNEDILAMFLLVSLSSLCVMFIFLEGKHEGIQLKEMINFRLKDFLLLT